MADSGKQLKRKRLSKNKKKSWKHINITDVEEFLEEERMQERTGGCAAEKTDDQLYFVDKEFTVEEPDSTKTTRRRRVPKPLKCFANLEPDPKIKPARVPHNIRKRTQIVKRLETKKSTVKQMRAEEQRCRDNEKREEKITAAKQLPVVRLDLWKDKHPENVEEDAFYMEVTKKRRVNLPSHYHQKTSGLAHVEVPPPGASYNPAYDDHQDLLQQAHRRELEKVKEERKLYNALDAHFPSRRPSEKTWLSEMSVGLFDNRNQAADETVSVEDCDKLSVNPPVRREDLKTVKQKRKARERREESQIAVQEKLKKRRLNDVFRLKSIKNEIKKKETELNTRRKGKAEIREKNKDKPKKLGKYKYKEPDLEVKLGHELVGSLRLLKPEGHLLEDRFKSLQKRNVIESRVKAKKNKKLKGKLFEKKSHKEIM